MKCCSRQELTQPNQLVYSAFALRNYPSLCHNTRCMNPGAFTLNKLVAQRTPRPKSQVEKNGDYNKQSQSYECLYINTGIALGLAVPNFCKNGAWASSLCLFLHA